MKSIAAFQLPLRFPPVTATGGMFATTSEVFESLAEFVSVTSEPMILTVTVWAPAAPGVQERGTSTTAPESTDIDTTPSSWPVAASPS